MKNVIDRLREYSNQIDLSNRFDFIFDPSDSIFTESETQRLLSEKTLFDQNVRLKWILKEKYENTTNSDSLDFWIINSWGGIRGFKPNDRNKEKVKTFRKQLLKRRLSKDSFSTISSLSKISSFIDPDNFVIYDSRVIYTLNWLILTCENQETFKELYFPMPSGRNKIISDFDMNTILNLFHISEYSQEYSLFISQQQAYFDYCDFVKKATIEVFGNNSKPYELEMLLFTLADKEIFEELKEKIKITTANKVYSQ
ncbi:hypothetical protein [Olleya marilimosa]|uniref:hypothetical protein n=1 Tax=Olleya marilimosa TaxID=272164 RepID=UPI00168CE702|nr:hypothetical protein [Olleya marilimosa]MBD3892247.1 hypothetical protein [Olleya marilimosa]